MKTDDLSLHGKFLMSYLVKSNYFEYNIQKLYKNIDIFIKVISYF